MKTDKENEKEMGVHVKFLISYIPSISIDTEEMISQNPPKR